LASIIGFGGGRITLARRYHYARFALQRPRSQIVRTPPDCKVMGNELTFSIVEVQQTVSRAIESQKTQCKRTEAPRLSATSSEEALILFKNEETPKRLLAKYQGGLISRPINGRAIVELLEVAAKEPLTAVLLSGVQLENSLMDLLISHGKIPPASQRNMETLAACLTRTREVSSDVQAAISKFSQTRNRLAHGEISFPRSDLAKLAMSGIELVELIERIPRDVIFVEDAGLLVFADKEGRIPLNKYEGVVLLVAAIPGQTGTHVIRLTTRKQYYVKGGQVSSEWEPSDISEAWVSYRNQTREVYTSGASVFIGNHIDELLAS
jgi:hypothetical protein